MLPGKNGVVCADNATFNAAGDDALAAIELRWL